MSHELARHFDRVELVWSGELEGTLMPGFMGLHHVVWEPDAPTPTSLPVVRLPLSSRLRIADFQRDEHMRDAPLVLVEGVPGRQISRRVVVPDRCAEHRLTVLDGRHGRALVLDPAEDEHCHELGSESSHVHLSWLDLATGDVRRAATVDTRWSHTRWRFRPLESGEVLVERNDEPFLLGLDGTTRPWPITGWLSQVAVGRDFMAVYRDGALERWTLDGRTRLSRLEVLQVGDWLYRDGVKYSYGLGAFFLHLQVDALGRVWGLGNTHGLVVLDAQDRLLVHLSPADFGNPAAFPYWHGLDAHGRLWFEEDGFFSSYRVWELEPELTAPALARTDDRSGLEPSL